MPTLSVFCYRDWQDTLESFGTFSYSSGNLIVDKMKLQLKCLANGQQFIKKLIYIIQQMAF